MEKVKPYTYKKENLVDEQIKLTVLISKEKFVQEKNHAYKELAKDIVITGFRPGMAPKAMIEARLGNSLYEEVFNHLIPEITYEILQSEQLNPINQVKYQVIKFSDAEGLEYTGIFIDYPKFALGDFKKIRLKKSEVKLDEQELEAEVKNVVKVYSGKQANDKGNVVKQEPKIGEPEPAVSDENVKKLNLGVTTVTELKAEVKKQLLARKQQVEEEKWLSLVVKEAVKQSKIKVPAVLLNEDVVRREADYRKKITELGLKVEDFLATQKTTMDDLKKKWQQEAEERIAQELLFVEIAKVQNIKITKEEIEQELNAVADPKLKEEFNSVPGKRYIATIKLQQKALTWLKQEVENSK